MRIKWGDSMSFLSSDPGSQALQWTAAAGTRWGEWGALCGDLITITIVALELLHHSRCPRNYQAAQGLVLSHQGQRVHNGREDVQMSRRWARCDDCLERGGRNHFHPRDLETVPLKNGREVYWQRLRGRTVYGENGLIKSPRGEGLCPGSTEWLWHWCMETAKRGL